MKPHPASAPTQPPPALPFNRVAALPRPGDSAAVARRLLPAGTRLTLRPRHRDGHDDDDHDDDVAVITLSAPCLEGHRFAVRRHSPGDHVTSWGLPFGRALCFISPGDVLVNDKMATALRERLSGPHDPDEADAIRQLLETQRVNFDDLDVSPDSPFVIEDRGGFNPVGRNRPAVIEEAEGIAGTFLGYPRDGGRGVGTRNHVVVIGLTGASAPLISPLSSRWKRYERKPTSTSSPTSDSANDAIENFDGVRIVAHTEGESSLEEGQFNSVHIHRCLAGFLCHPNVGAAVVVTTGRERHVTPVTLRDFVRRCNAEAEAGGDVPPYPTSCFESPHARFVQLGRGSDDGVADVFGPLDEAVSLAVNHATSDRVERRSVPLSNLRLALQCGGSDAFSGLTGNPLAGAVASRLIHEHGGSAVLAESPELVGAEPYILDRVADEDVARRFVEVTERYKRYGARHGTSVAGNPSGGNLYRGLYNIVLKSLGAARKKAEDVALDCVLEYGEPIPVSAAGGRGGGDGGGDHGGCHYAFMDSPGNDLESIAGQVAGGCNLIIFITGNGAMTNFPFVPTIKVVTTSRRYRLLEHEMDVDAGPYGCDGGEERGRVVDDAFDLCVRVASGTTRSRGEMAGHSQVSLWRNWAVGDGERGAQGGTADAAPLDENFRGECTDHLCLFGMVEPHVVRPDPPAVLPDSLLREPPVRRAVPPHEAHAGGNNNVGGVGILRPWSCGASYALIPTSLCSSAVATTIADRYVSQGGRRHRRIICPSHTEGCGAASADPAYDRTYQRLLLGTAFHPSVRRALFLEHGCEKTHNDYFRNCIREALAAAVVDDDRGTDGADTSSPPIHPDSMFGFWSLQAGGGLDNAERYVAEYFGRNDDEDCGGNDRPPNGERVGATFSPLGGTVSFGSLSWTSRAVAVGIMVDDAALLASESATRVDPECDRDSLLLASALATVARFLSRVGVHSVLPVNSTLLAPSSPCHVNGAKVGGSPAPLTATGDMEDMFAVRPRRRAEGRPRPGRWDEGADVEGGGDGGGSSSSSTVGSLFAAEALEDGTVPDATLLAGQMINRRRTLWEAETTTGPGGLHVMDVPVGAAWDETVSCLGPACDVMLIVGDSTSTTTLLPGSCLVPTLRRTLPAPQRSSGGVIVDEDPSDSAHAEWSRWIADTCSELLEVLRSPLICGGDVQDHEEVDSLEEALFSVTTFVVPRGNAVSF